MPKRTQTQPERRRNRAVRIAIGAIACIPLIYGGALVWANQDPTHRLDRIPAAVVDLDQPVARDGQTVDVGASLAHELTTDHQGTDFDWVETDAATARAGLTDGRYLATITLPKDLSADAAALGGNAPLATSASKITIATDDGQNYIVGVAAKTIGLAISQSASKSVSQQYLSQIYAGLDQISGRLGDAASGAAQLATGASTLGTGAAELDTGTQQSAAAAAQLASGLGTLSSGAQSLASGTAQVSTGAQSLADGTGQLATGADQLSSGLSQLAAKTDGLPQQSAAITAGASALSSGLAQHAAQVDQLISLCQTLTSSAGTPDASVAELCTDVQQLGGAQQLAAQASALSSAVPALTSAVDQAAAGASTLAGKAHEAAAGAQSVARGAQQTASGAGQLASAARQASAGASALATGTAQVASGAGSVDSGAQQVASGSSQLASKLADGKASVPSYSAAEQKHLSSVASQPIAFTQDKLNGVPSYGYGLAPYFMALGTWVGGLSIYMLLRAIPSRAIAAGRPGWLAAMIGYLRGAGISLLQAALLYLVVTVGIGVHPEHPLGLALFLGVAGLAFTAVNHALMVVFGSRGRFLGLILLVLQVAAAGATYPIQTTPGFFQVIHGLVPLTYAANAIRSLIAGGGAGVAAGVVVMVCWLAGALAISVATTAFRGHRRAELLLPDFAI